MLPDTLAYARALVPAVHAWALSLDLATVAAWSLNAAGCLAVAWAYMCRARVGSLTTMRPAYVALYAISGAVAVLAAVLALVEPLAPWPHIAMVLCWAWHMALGSRRWRTGVPPDVASRPMPLT